MRGTSENLTGEDSSLLLKAASLQGTADGAELTAPLETRKHLEHLLQLHLIFGQHLQHLLQLHLIFGLRLKGGVGLRVCM